MSPIPPDPAPAKWQDDAFGRRKHSSSWCWEGTGGTTSWSSIPPSPSISFTVLVGRGDTMANNDSGGCLPLTGKGPVRHDAHGASCGKSAAKGELTMSAQKRGARGTSDACPLHTQGGSDPGHNNYRPLGRKRKEGGKFTKKTYFAGSW
jgi:hypothetical protein